MGKKRVYITNRAYFENTGAGKRRVLDEAPKLEALAPHLFETECDLFLGAYNEATKEERDAPFYNNFRERYGSEDIAALLNAAKQSKPKRLYLAGLCQSEWEALAPILQDNVKELYLFKCSDISNLSLLKGFQKLEVVALYHNRRLTHLWEMHQNERLKFLSFTYVTKLECIDPLTKSQVEYVNFDSADNYGNKQAATFDRSFFENAKTIKHLFLNYKGLSVSESPIQ